MQKLIIIMLVCALMLAAQANAGWFNNNEEQQRWREMQMQLEKQRKATGGWQLVAGLFAIGTVLLFTVGTAIGSRVRRHEKAH